MTGFLLASALVIGVLLCIGLHRVWSGPTVLDRLVAVALVTANTMVILVLVASVLDRIDTVIDIAIGYALLAFVVPIALGKHFELRQRARTSVAEEADTISRDDDTGPFGGAS